MARFSKLHSRCPEGHFTEDNLTGKICFFFIFLFGFWTKSNRSFPEKILAEFKKSVLRFQRNSLWEPASQKKLWNKNIWGNFLTNLWLLMENFWPFCQNCILPVKQLSDGKQHLRVKYWLVNFFWTLGANSQCFGETAYSTVVQTASTCLKGKQFWVPIFEQKLWFWKIL